MSIFKKLEADSRNLSSAQNISLNRILEHIQSLIFEEDISDEIREKRLSDIDKYLTKKARQSNQDLVGDKAEYLRYVRNSIMHNTKPSLKTLEEAMPVFWLVLGKSAPQWNSTQLGHLLSYALKMKSPMAQTQEKTPKEVVQFYKKIFNSLPKSEKGNAFIDLLLSIYISDEFQLALGKKKRVMSKEGQNDN